MYTICDTLIDSRPGQPCILYPVFLRDEKTFIQEIDQQFRVTDFLPFKPNRSIKTIRVAQKRVLGVGEDGLIGVRSLSRKLLFSEICDLLTEIAKLINEDKLDSVTLSVLTNLCILKELDKASKTPIRTPRRDLETGIASLTEQTFIASNHREKVSSAEDSVQLAPGELNHKPSLGARAVVDDVPLLLSKVSPVVDNRSDVEIDTELSESRLVLDMLPLCIWFWDADWKIKWANRAYVEFVRANSLGEVVGNEVELLQPQQKALVASSVSRGAPYRRQMPVMISGRGRDIELSAFAIGSRTVGVAVDITELKATQDSFRERIESNVRTIDQLTAGIAVFGRDRHLLFHNAAFRALWGLSAEWLASGPEESAILDQLRTDRKLPEQSNYREWRSGHLAAYDGNERREYLWHLPDGRTLRVVALPNSDGGMTYVQENVTEQITLESRLMALSQLQGETLDHLAEAVAVFGTDGRVRLLNPVFCEIWRLSPTMLKSEPHIGEIITSCKALYDDDPVWDAIHAAVTSMGHDVFEIGRMQRLDGSVVDYATVPLPEGMVMLTFVDVTDSARVERVLKERNEALEAADRLKSDFIQHVSYELRSPLQAIIGFSELLSEAAPSDLKAEEREYVEHISSSSMALLALVDDILDLATIEAGLIKLDMSDTDIAALVNSAVEGVRDRLIEQQIVLTIDIPKNIGTFYVDEGRMRQVLFNLISNATRFSNARGHIRVEAARERDSITFNIVDNGAGIPEHMIPAIFQPFEIYPTEAHLAGAGLGLSIAKSLVELHGGSIDIRSEEGNGTTATVRIPVTPATKASVAA
jgi:signal transduction histidine kinase